MYRAEIVANQSVQEDITELLEETIPDVLYTIIPVVYGRGKDDRKLGTTSWPETNFLMLSYVADKKVPLVKAVIEAVKNRFPNEGIKLFLLKSEN